MLLTVGDSIVEPATIALTRTHISPLHPTCSDFNNLLSRNFLCRRQLCYTFLPWKGWCGKDPAHAAGFLTNRLDHLSQRRPCMGVASMSGFAEYEHYDALGLADLVRRRQVTADELLDAAIARVEARNPSVNAVVMKL